MCFINLAHVAIVILFPNDKTILEIQNTHGMNFFKKNDNNNNSDNDNIIITEFISGISNIIYWLFSSSPCTLKNRVYGLVFVCMVCEI